MSKYPAFLSSPSSQTAPLFLICFHLRRDAEMLAQRVKRARASTGGQPPVGTSSTPLVVESSPDSSPRRSPQRAFITHSPSMCVGYDLLVLTLPWLQEEGGSRRSH